MADKKRSWYSVIAPGILLAATGVGAGDLMTSGLAGSALGLGVLWAVVVGAVVKWALSEGIARWQLATGTTMLEGWSWKLGGWIRWVFFIYLTLFALVVGGALTSACGVAGAGLAPLSDDPATSRIIWGVLHSAVGVLLVLRGSFRFFEILMSALVGLMFVTVISAAVAIGPDWSAVAAGFVPRIPEGGVDWVIALLGGVGGTVTLLSYGYWIAESGRRGLADVPVCRIDLAVGNGMTALFGVAVVILGSSVELEGQGAMLALKFAEQLREPLGAAGSWVFLIGFWGAVFSSLLGVWQSIPYLFADFLDLQGGREPGVRTQLDLRTGKPYRGAVLFIAIVPLVFLWAPVSAVQILYGVFGALFLPLLSLTLLILNNRRRWVGSDFLSPWAINVMLGAGLAFFAYLGADSLWARFGG